MTTTHESDGSIRYRSRGGQVAFGIWCFVILAIVVFAAWNAAVYGEPPWFAVAGTGGLLVLGLYQMSLEVILSVNDSITFRGLLRRRTWSVMDLRKVEPGSFCIVFRFESGGAMVASSGADDWLDMCRRIKKLNPQATMHMPGMFRLPFEANTDVES
jgi:hypothetical protein